MRKIKLPTLAELMAFFFDASLHGWVNQETEIIQGHLGERSVSYQQGDLTYYDRWYVGDSRFHDANASYGKTLITCHGKVIWVMQYNGWYEEDIVDQFVKPALLAAYQAGEFYGGRGRGLEKLTDSELGPVYMNDLSVGYIYGNPQNPFRMIYFQGQEYVRDKSRRYGEHYYQGMVLDDELRRVPEQKP